MTWSRDRPLSYLPIAVLDAEGRVWPGQKASSSQRIAAEVGESSSDAVACEYGARRLQGVLRRVRSEHDETVVSSGSVEIDVGGVLLSAPLAKHPNVRVIHQTMQGPWTLPQGRVRRGESLVQAAIRVTFEQTGYDSEVLGFAGARTLKGDNGDTCTCYFSLLRKGDASFGNRDGRCAAEWVSPEDACRRVSQRELPHVLAATVPELLQGPLRGSGKSRKRFSWRLRSLRSAHRARLARVSSAISMYNQEVQALRGRDQADQHGPEDPNTPSQGETWWRTPADNLLTLAQENAAEGKVNAAWEALNISQRLTLNEFNVREIQARTEVLRAEVPSKLTGWRREAAIAALTGEATWPPTGLQTAQELLDQHTSNVYLKLELAGRRIFIAAMMLVLTILGLLLATARQWFGVADTTSKHFVLQDPGLFGGVLLLGIFGSMLSLALDTASSDPNGSRIYELATTQFALPLARLSIGAGSGVLVVAAAQAGFVGGDQPWLYLTAIPAGFSERLVRRSVENIAANASQSVPSVRA